MKLLMWFKAKVIIIFAIMLGLLLLAGWFYWFEYRSSNIRKNCYELAEDNARELYRIKVDLPPGEPSIKERTFIEQGMFLKADMDSYYEGCLHKEGLK